METEHEAGEALFAAFNPMESDDAFDSCRPTDSRTRTSSGMRANCSPSRKPTRRSKSSPTTLDSMGAWTFGGKLAGPMTAHPKLDPETGEMVFFGYNAEGAISPDMSFHVVDRHGTLTRSETFEAPYAAMVHDFMVTKDHVIFPIMPLTGSLERAMQGAPVYAWEPEKGTHIGIMPRNGNVAEMRWFKGEPGYVFHPMNAHTDGDTVVCDVCECEPRRCFRFPTALPAIRARPFRG